MKILIVSGFLGAGKTTFIKELIRRSGIHPVILENEYGGNTIDADELRGLEQDNRKIDVMEFMEGCVCCTLKDKFKNSVLTIFSGLNPEYLIVEPTGIGRLSNLVYNLQSILHDNITLLKPIVILSPHTFRRNISQWRELYTDQIINAQTVIFTKIEQADSTLLFETVDEIRQLNPTAEIVHEHYSLQDDFWWRSLLALHADSPSVTADSSKNEEEFSQLTLNDAHLDNPSQLVMILEDCLRGDPGLIVRAKGTLPVGNEILRFDLADNLYVISGSPQETNQCVFIGKELNRDMLCRRLGSSLLA